ncbi:hypothetical protein ACVWWK_001264 [Bradyrhizobium sp. LB9.1b]
MPELARCRDPHPPDCWRIHFYDVVGITAKAGGNRGAADARQWSCGRYPGSRPGEHRNGLAPPLEAAREASEAAWRQYLPKRTETDFQASRDHQACTAEKCRRFGRGERMLPDLRPHV